MGNKHGDMATAASGVSGQGGGGVGIQGSGGCVGSQGGGGGCGLGSQGGGGGCGLGSQGGDGGGVGSHGGVGVGSQGGGSGGSQDGVGVRDIYEWDEGGWGICRAGARGSRNVGANHGPGWGSNVGAIYGSGAGGGGNIGSIYRDVEGRDGNVAGIYEHGAEWDSDHRAGARLRGNIGAIYAAGARNTGGNIDEIFLGGPGSGGTVGGSSRDGV